MENRRFKGIFLNDDDTPTGETFIGWHARNMAVVLIIADLSKRKVLLEKRGPGCPDNIGKWCCPCGYLNWDETLKQAAAREAYEETGLLLNPEKVTIFYINDDPKAHLQNVTARCVANVNESDILEKMHNGTINTDTLSRGGEGNEVSEFIWISLDDIKSNFNSDDFAFNHYDMINDFFNNVTYRNNEL